MKALVYTGPGTLAFQDAPEPVAETGEVVVQVEAVGICGSDMHAWHGHDSRRPPPVILGHEAAGTVITGSRAGQRVTINPLVVDPACPYAIAGQAHLSPARQIISMPPRPGAFAERVRVPERNVLAIPDRMTTVQAALTEPVAVSWHAVRVGSQRLNQPLAACKVVVLGGGAIGLAAALVARCFGAHRVLVGEINPSRRRTLAAMEELTVFDPGGPDSPGESSVDMVIDAVGAARTRADACAMVRPGGTIVHIGLLPGHDGLDIRKITLQEITLTGSYCYTVPDFQQTLQALAEGQLGDLRWFEERPLSDGARAFADLDAGLTAAAKIILRPGT